MTKSLIFSLVLVSAASVLSAIAQTTATINIDTTNTLSVNPHFSGYNNEVADPTEYWDYRFNTMALALNPAWVRFPGGISSDAYNWQTGQEDPSWVSQFSSNKSAGVLLPEMQVWLAGKGGARFIDAANRAHFLNAQLIVDVNAFTDTPQSVGQMAAYAKANGIPAPIWELSNEAYNFSDFFKNGTDYLNQMKPFYDAIKAANPSAIVAVFANNPGSAASPNPVWDQAIANYPNKYWDAITFHYYPPNSNSSNFNVWMADENAVLAGNSSSYVTGYLSTLSPPGTPVVISEFDPSAGDAGGTTTEVSLTNGTLYGAIYCAEFTMRMSTVPNLLHVGSHEIANDSGVESTNSGYGQTEAAGQAGTPINTINFNFGYYYGAQAYGVGIINGAINQAVKSNKTTVTGGATVAATGMGQIPAVYAMAYSNVAGGLSVVMTNKSATAHQVTVQVNGTAATGTFPIQYITGTDPSTSNSPTNKTAVATETGSSSNPVTLPPYSVLRADLVIPAVATMVSSASYQGGTLAPQQLVSAFGSGFASQAMGASTQPLPTTLGNTTITVTDSSGAAMMAPLDYVSPSQANFQLPAGLAAGPATVKVIENGSTVLTGSLTVAAVAPGIFTANGNGSGVIAGSVSRMGPEGTTALPLFSCVNGVALSCLDTPLPLGTSSDTVYVTLFATGIRGAKSVTVYVAGQSVPVQYAGPQGQFAGLDQVNITLPQSLAGTGEASLYLIADGQMSNVASLNIQ